MTTTNKLEQWNRYSELDEYSKILIRSLKSQFVRVRDSDRVRMVPLDLHVPNCLATPENSSGCIYSSSIGDILVKKTGEVHLWKNQVGKLVDNIKNLMFNKVKFKTYTVYPEVEAAFNRPEMLRVAPGWWKILVEHIRLDCLETRPQSRWWEPNNSELDWNKSYQIYKRSGVKNYIKSSGHVDC